MSRDKKKDEKNQKKSRSFTRRVFYVWGVIMVVFILVAVAHGVYMTIRDGQMFEKLENRIVFLEDSMPTVVNPVDQANVNVQGLPVTDSNLEFLKDQMKSHQEFIEREQRTLAEQLKSHQDFVERERETLIWMLGIIVTIAGGIFAFIGIKSKTDVEEIIEGIYENQISDQLDTLLNRKLEGKENVNYLVKMVAAEKVARKKSVIFLLQKNSKLEKVLEKYRGFLDVDPKVETLSSAQIAEERIARILEDYEIVIYEARTESCENSNGNPGRIADGTSEGNAKNINKYCIDAKNEKQVIFFVDGRLSAKIDTTFCEMVNSPNKLYQSLDSLLFR